MTGRRFLGAITLLLAAAPLLLAADRRPMTFDDHLRMVRLGDVCLTPDGRFAFYSERYLNWDENRYDRRFFLAPTDGDGKPRPFVGEAGGSSFRFSPDGRFLSFLRKVKQGDDETEQIHVLAMDGGEAKKLTDHVTGVRDFRWVKDGRSILFTADEPRAAEQEKEWKKGADAVYVDEGPNGKSAGHWTALWRFDVESEATARLTDAELIIEGFDVSPDGARVAFVARTDDRTNYPHRAELYLLDVRDRRLRRLTENEAPESDPSWSPDGKRLLYRAPHDRFFDLRSGYFWVMNPDNGERRRLGAQQTGEVDHVAWSPDGRSILFNEVRGTDTNLVRLDVEADTAATLTHERGTLRALAYSEDRARVVFSFSDFDTPADLHVAGAEFDDARRLTRANPWVEEELLLASGEIVRWKSQGGMEIEGAFLLPPTHRSGQKAPLMLHIHGGPSGYFGNEFDPEFQVYAGLGYASLGANVRGSSGYGDELLRGLMGDVGGGEYTDLMTGVDHVLATGAVDGERMGVRGWSWGGVLGGWVVTHTDRFRAASLGAMVCDWTAETGPGFNFDVSLWYIGGTHWDDPEEWRRRSSLSFIRNCKTPTLLLHGAADATSSTNQSMMFFTALKDRGIPTRFVKFPRQRHGIREPRLRRIAWVEELAWMQRHVLGLEWKAAAFDAASRGRPEVGR